MSSLIPPEFRKLEVLRLADYDQPTGPCVEDAVDSLPQSRARGNHLERLHQPRLCPYFGIEIFAGT